MKEIFAKEKIFWVIAAVLVVSSLCVGGYIAYQQYTKATTVTTNTGTDTQSSDSKYPAKTIIEDTSDPDIKKINPSKNDTVQVKTESGDTVEIPIYKPPVKN